MIKKFEKLDRAILHTSFFISEFNTAAVSTANCGNIILIFFILASPTLQIVQSPVFLLKFFVGFFLEFGQKLLQQFFGSVSVFECTALIRKMECGALSSMKDELKLDFGFTIWADLLTCTEKNIYLVREQPGIVLVLPFNRYRYALTANICIQVADSEPVFSLWTPGNTLSHQIKSSILFSLSDFLHHQQHFFW